MGESSNISVIAFATLAGVPPASVYAAISKDLISTVRYGRAIRISREEADRVLREGWPAAQMQRGRHSGTKAK